MTPDQEMQAKYLVAARRLISLPGFEAALLTPDPKTRRLRDDEDLLAPPSPRELAEMQAQATRVVQARDELARIRQRLDLAISMPDQPLVSEMVLELMWGMVGNAAKMVDRRARGRPKGTTLSANEIEGHRRIAEADLGRPPTQEKVAAALQRLGLAVTTRMIGRIYRAQFGRWPTG